MKLMVLIVLIATVKKLKENYFLKELLLEREAKAKMATVRVYCYLKRLAKWRGESVTARNRIVLRHNMAFHNYVSHLAYKERAMRKLKEFLIATSSEFNFVVLVRIHHRRMESIQRGYKRTRGAQGEYQRKIVEDIISDCGAKLNNFFIITLNKPKRGVGKEWMKSVITPTAKLDYYSKLETATIHL